MAKKVIIDRKYYFSSFDLTGHHNNVELVTSCEIKDGTTFGNQWRQKLPGLKDWTCSNQGYFEAGDGAYPDPVLAGNLAVSNVPVTICPDTGADGEIAYFGRMTVGSYAPDHSIGDISGFTSAGASQSPLLRGTVLKNASGIAASGDGTAYELGAVSATQSVYAAMHVISVSGGTPSITVTLESDADALFDGSETVRATFTAATGIASEYITPISGAISDTWWRASYAVSGSTPAFAFIVSMSIY